MDEAEEERGNSAIARITKRKREEVVKREAEKVKKTQLQSPYKRLAHIRKAS